MLTRCYLVREMAVAFNRLSILGVLVGAVIGCCVVFLFQDALLVSHQSRQWFVTSDTGSKRELAMAPDDSASQNSIPMDKSNRILFFKKLLWVFGFIF